VSFVQADAASLPFASRCFDVVAFHDALEHLPAVERALQQALRVVRPGGWLVVFSPNLISPLRSWSLLAQGARSGKWHPDASPCFWLCSLCLNALKVTGLRCEFTYRRPLVRDLTWPGSDYDAIYLANPLDLLHFSRRHGLRVQHVAEGTSRVGKLVAHWLPWFAGGIAFVAQKPAEHGPTIQAQDEK
jgi:SAM-dependent methyltransferase